MSGTQHSFNILPDQAYDHIDIGASREAAMHVEAALFYHGSLVMRTERVRRVLEDLLSSMRLPVFVDVNLRDPWWQEEDLPPVFQRARWIKVNEEELAIIANHFGLSADNQEKTAKQLQEKYDLEQLILTRGEQGAVAFDASHDVVEVIPKRVSEIIDTVGAGDAFSSVVVLGLLKGWPCRLTMERAQDFASRICRQRGATSADPDLYREMMQQWGEAL
jgi:fructokinase